MYLEKLSLLHYKNFLERKFEFDTKINCLVGDNGVGKTNVLDSIYHLAMGKSYFNPIGSQNIHHGKDFFLIEGLFHKNGREEAIVCSLKRGTNKVIKRNGKTYDRLSEHIGLLPLVIISPADRDLILEGSETRRKFVDSVISQANKEYLQQLINYNKVLAQRNALLKYFALNHTFDSDTLEVYNGQMAQYGTYIHEKRSEFIADFAPIFTEQYSRISGGKEAIALAYKSQLGTDSMMELFQSSLEKDRALQYTTTGVHKDDLLFTIDDLPIKKFGSQGQQKSYLIALKMAQYYFTESQAKTTPILLLDDIFDKLDEQRVAHIISMVDEENFGQIFISDTHAERTENVVKSVHQTYKVFKL